MSDLLRVGYVPYLNMAPFHQGFGPEPFSVDQLNVEFHELSPHALGQGAAQNTVDAGAISLVDLFDQKDTFEPVGNWGIATRREAQSVLLFSRRPIATLAEAVIGVTDETSTSSRLLQLLLEQRYGLKGIRYEPADSEESMDAQLFIGDAAWRARVRGLPGFPEVTDLGEQWYEWQRLPFVFARWATRKDLSKKSKNLIERNLKNSFLSTESYLQEFSQLEADARGWNAQDVARYWNGFAYQLDDRHLAGIERFRQALETACLIP